MRLIKLIFKPLDISVFAVLSILTLIVLIIEFILKVIWFVSKPIRVIIKFIAKLIKAKINKYKYKDSWKDYYNE